MAIRTSSRARSDRDAAIVYEQAPGAACAPLGRWRRRCPEQTALWKLVATELPAFIAEVEEATGRGLPGHVERELSRYLDCGILARGFARVVCRDCRREILVAFSCHGRGLCPSCTSRRMADCAAHLVDRVVPRVPVRQWVITFPRRVRWHLARDPKLASQVLALCLRVIFAWQRKMARRRGVDFGAPKRSQSARCAAVAFIQRFDSSLALDWHLHALLCDGVFVRPGGDPEARPRFERLPPPSDEEVAALLSKIAVRVVAHLVKRGRLNEDDDAPDDLGTQLDLLAARPLIPAQGEIAAPPPLCARRDGFSLHAGRFVHEHDRQGLEQLARYCARPALALDRLSFADDGMVHYKMKRVFSNGRSEVVLPPRDFLARLCALIPPPRANLVRYFGAFAPGARGRAALVGKRAARKEAPPTAPSSHPPADPPASSDAGAIEDPTALGAPPPDAHRPTRLDWAALLRRVFAIDVLVCAGCGGPLRVIAFITDDRVVRRILHHLGIAPVVRPRAHGPPAEDSLPPGDVAADDPCIDPTPAD